MAVARGSGRDVLGDPPARPAAPTPLRPQSGQIGKGRLVQIEPKLRSQLVRLAPQDTVRLQYSREARLMAPQRDPERFEIDVVRRTTRDQRGPDKRDRRRADTSLPRPYVRR